LKITTSVDASSSANNVSLGSKIVMIGFRFYEEP